jgi:hypothetical protein
MGENKPMYMPPQVISLDRLASAAGINEACKTGYFASVACGFGDAIGQPCKIGQGYAGGVSP